MDPEQNAARGSGAAGEAARDRLRELLAHAAGSAVAVGLMNGVGSDDPGATGGPGAEGGPGADDPPSGGEPAGPVPVLDRLCALAVSEVGVSGAGVTVMGSVADGIAGRRDQIACQGAWSRHLEDLQLTAGQGPCLHAFATGAPVLVGDLADEAGRWPGFAPEALAVGVVAVFSLPLQVGAVQLGTLDLNRTTAGSLAPAQLEAALLLAGLATETLLEHAAGSGPDGVARGAAGLGWLADVHSEVHQASGMVAVAEHIGVGRALVRIRAHAYATGRPIAEVASRIVAHDLVLTDPDPDP